MATQTQPAAKLSRDRKIAALRIREQAEAGEDARLAPGAARSRDARRDKPEDADPVRLAYALDRDRIVHSKAFRRLKHKTQVFLAPIGDHYRTRLTHTLEVNQIARTIARALELNEDLVDAMALGHDIGHTPFGHIGEEVLAEFLPGFRHNEQSVRIVERLEKGGHGLNVSTQTRDGMLKHSATSEGLDDAAWGVPSTLEGKVLRYADKIAYMNHDVDDAMRAGMLSEDDVPADVREAIGWNRAERLDTMVYDVIVSSYGKDDVAMSIDVLKATNAFRDYMFSNVYLSGPAKTEDEKAKDVVRALLEHFERRPEQMPAEYAPIAASDGVKRAVADYVSGMTDRYALDVYASLFIPRAWHLA
jgi:dGTPase